MGKAPRRPEEAGQEDPKKTPAGPARPKKSQVQVAKKCQDQTAAANRAASPHCWTQPASNHRCGWRDALHASTRSHVEPDPGSPASS
jgi:hypothetical protein